MLLRHFARKTALWIVIFLTEVIFPSESPLGISGSRKESAQCLRFADGMKYGFAIGELMNRWFRRIRRGRAWHKWRRNRCRAARFELLENRSLLANIIWIGANPHDPQHTHAVRWSEPDNWIGGQLPGPNDTAIFDASATQTVDGTVYQAHGIVLVDTSDFTIAGIQVSENWGGQYDFQMVLAANLTLTGTSEWDAGMMQVGNANTFLTITNRGTLTVGGAGDKRWAASGLSGLTLENQGALIDMAGTLTCSYLTVNNSGTFLHSADTLVLENTTLNNSGTFTQSGGLLTVTDSDVYNLVGGLIDLQSDSNIGDTSSQLTNVGTLRKSAGSANLSTGSFIGLLLNNVGTVEAKAGNLVFVGGVAQVVGNELTGGTWSIFDTATLSLNSDIHINSANVTLSGASPIFDDLENLDTNNGTLSLLGGFDITTAGALRNNGTVMVGAGSILTVPGNLTQSASGVVNIQYGGTPASGLFGQIKVTSGGVATLGGTLASSFVTGFTPAVTDNYAIMTFPSRSGTFGGTSGPSPPGRMIPAYNTGDVTVHLDRSPSAASYIVSTLPNRALTINVMDDCSDPEQQPMLLGEVTPAANGALFINADQSVTYTPNPGTSGIDRFNYTVQDAVGNFATATINVMVTTHVWHNLLHRLDTNANGIVTASDALDVINYINAFGARYVPSTVTSGPPFLDTTDDNLVAAVDALDVINFINAFGPGLPGPSGEGETVVAIAADRAFADADGEAAFWNADAGVDALAMLFLYDSNTGQTRRS